MMEIRKIIIPDNRVLCSESIKLWNQVFGGGYSLDVESETIFGCEKEYNTDILYVALEDGQILGTCRSTTPIQTPWITGIGEVCTAPFARGKGISNILLERMFYDITDKTSFLGTENPIAAKLYYKHGFQFITGSNVMIRASKSYQDFNENYFTGNTFSITSGSASLRISCIPLCLFRGNSFIMDINAGVFSTDKFTQRSCMGLYPRFKSIVRNGGVWLVGLNERGNLCASATAVKLDEKWRIDAFAHPAYERYIPDLISNLKERTDGNTFVTVSSFDKNKSDLFRQMGYRLSETKLLPINGVYMDFALMIET